MQNGVPNKAWTKGGLLDNRAKEQLINVEKCCSSAAGWRRCRMCLRNRSPATPLGLGMQLRRPYRLGSAMKATNATSSPARASAK